MDRQKFSQLLINQREQQQCGKNELCRRIGFTFHQLQNIEQAKNNYNFNLIIKYLSGIQSQICLINNKSERKIIMSYDDFVSWMIVTRTIDYSQRSLAQKIGVAYLTIANIERKATVISVDTFLKIAEALEVEIKIEKCS